MFILLVAASRAAQTGRQRLSSKYGCLPVPFHGKQHAAFIVAGRDGVRLSIEAGGTGADFVPECGDSLKSLDACLNASACKERNAMGAYGYV